MSPRQPSSASCPKPLVSVLTPTIPGREDLLREACRSVKAQTLRNQEHIVYTDTTRDGCAKTVNRIAGMARGEWLLILADDDILLPRCLELLVAARDGDAVVYSPPLVWGEDPTQFQGTPPNIPSLALIPTSVWQSLGGYNEHLAATEDRDLWTRAVERGVRFVRYDQAPTWVYRFHGGNKSRS